MVCTYILPQGISFVKDNLLLKVNSELKYPNVDIYNAEGELGVKLVMHNKGMSLKTINIRLHSV